ncbi:riboflavin kinase [Methylonatrum kenyense]|uniref:riboflavin kinase n=1 Tax=Methylonatrum kenyense TaxID=455253 RepID=UPI0020BD5993|nr:riboflavin kinase [Methylonatrum kenyense]MCK8517193.1 riboflavin kinase [Methylonatrum kenyense]
MNNRQVLDVIPSSPVMGQVLHGQKVGRRLGFPTANLSLAEADGPPFGVYAVLARVGGHCYAASASWGRRPHFDNGRPLLEVHLLDFEGDLYGCDLEVEFVARLRGEQIFSSTDALIEQIAIDVRTTRSILSNIGAFM